MGSPESTDRQGVGIRPVVAALPPYRQGASAPAGSFKLSSNENPFDPLPSVLEAAHLAGSFNRYPDASASRLRRALADRHGVELENVHVGAGSVAIIAQLLSATVEPGDEVIFPWPSFEGYPLLCTVAGARLVPTPLTEDHTHDLEAMSAGISPRTRVIVVCTPNNPTGTTVTRREFESFLATVPPSVLVILDEAYVEFVRDTQAVDGQSYMGNGGPANVVVLRTFSKAHGLAALRIGYAVGHPRVLDAARACAIPLSVTAHAEEAALASLRSYDLMWARVEEIVARRDRLVADIRRAGCPVPISQGNFVWIPAAEESGHVAKAFESAGLIVREYPGDGVRITVGEAASNAVILDTIRALSQPFVGSVRG